MLVACGLQSLSKKHVSNLNNTLSVVSLDVNDKRDDHREVVISQWGKNLSVFRKVIAHLFVLYPLEPEQRKMFKETLCFTFYYSSAAFLVDETDQINEIQKVHKRLKRKE